MKATSLVVALLAPAISSCGHGAHDRTAPCKPPSSLTAFHQEVGEPCGPITRINQDHWAVIDAIQRMTDNQGE
jgi:hypothetical protein